MVPQRNLWVEIPRFVESDKFLFKTVQLPCFLLLSENPPGFRCTLRNERGNRHSPPAPGRANQQPGVLASFAQFKPENHDAGRFSKMLTGKRGCWSALAKINQQSGLLVSICGC